MIAAMSLFAATARASSGRSSTRGTTSAASTPRITITTMISISVKPRPRTARRRRAHRAHYNRAGLERGRVHVARDRPVAHPMRRALLLVTGLLLIVAAWRVAALALALDRTGRCRCRARRTTSRSAAARRCAASRASCATTACCRTRSMLVGARAPARRRPLDQGRQLRDRAGHHAARSCSPSSRRAT